MQSSESRPIKSEGRRYIPHHDQRTTDRRGSTLSGIDRDGRGFGANTETEEEPGNEEVPPRVRKTLPNARDEGDERGDENRAATSEVLVHRGGQPAADDTAA